MGQQNYPTMSEMVKVLAEARVNFTPHERKYYVLKEIENVLILYCATKIKGDEE